MINFLFKTLGIILRLQMDNQKQREFEAELSWCLENLKISLETKELSDKQGNLYNYRVFHLVCNCSVIEITHISQA